MKALLRLLLFALFVFLTITVAAFVYLEWWQAILDHHFTGLDGLFVHPVSDPAVMAGNGTIGLEILEDLPDVDIVLVPWGGGGLSCGIACALRGSASRAAVWACEVATAAGRSRPTTTRASWTGSARELSWTRCGRSRRKSSPAPTSSRSTKSRPPSAR